MINAVLHALATWRYGAYSPGTVSGLLIYVPMGIVVLREMRSYLSMSAFAACLGAGAIAHVFITFVAFR